jgi:hypothetical protein
MRQPYNDTISDRLWSKTEWRGRCLVFTGARLPYGYGLIGSGGHDGVNLLAHRVAYELSIDVIPDDMTVDHLCNNPPCVNPEHLEMVTMAENLARAKTRRVRCRRGHEMTAENTVMLRGGGRRCRKCDHLMDAARYVRNRENRKAAVRAYKARKRAERNAGNHE